MPGCEGTAAQWDAPRHQRGEDVCGLREEPQRRGARFWAPCGACLGKKRPPLVEIQFLMLPLKAIKRPQDLI